MAKRTIGETVEWLATAVQQGFIDMKEEFKAFKTEVNERFDAVDGRFDRMETRLDRIEHIILIDHRDRIERLEEHAFSK